MIDFTSARAIAQDLREAQAENKELRRKIEVLQRALAQIDAVLALTRPQRETEHPQSSADNASVQDGS